VLRRVAKDAVAAGVAVDQVVPELNEEAAGAGALEVAAGGLLAKPSAQDNSPLVAARRGTARQR
jgi:hypothetical protein